MGDTIDGFKAMKEHNRQERRDRQSGSRELLEAWCLENSVDMRIIADFQFRLMKGDRKIDVFPTSRRFHNLKTNARGGYKNLIDFVGEHFKAK